MAQLQIDLAGLWKDSRRGLLVQIHGAKVFIDDRISADHWMGDMMGPMKTVKGILRIIVGDTAEDRLYASARLVSVMPKRGVQIQLVDSFERGPTMYDFEGVVMVVRS